MSDQKERLSREVRFVKRHYKLDGGLRFEVGIPEPVDCVNGSSAINGNGTRFVPTMVPPLSRQGDSVVIHPCVLGSQVPLYVTRYLVFMALCEHHVRTAKDQHVVALMRDLMARNAPYPDRALKWLERNGFNRESLEVAV